MKSFILTVTLFIGTQVFAQDYHPAEIISTRDGLSHRHIKQINKDKDGFMWIATEEGLNRYDGVEWKVFMHQKDDSTSISNNHILSTLVDEKGNLFIEMFNENRKRVWDYYDKKTNTFRRSSKEEVAPFIEKSRNWLYTYQLGKQLAWLKTDRPEYILKDETSDEIQKITFSNFGGYSLPIDKKGRFWYPASNTKNDSLFTSIQLPKEVPLSDWHTLKIDNLSHIWLMTKERKVYILDTKNKVFYAGEEGMLDEVKAGYSVFQDEEGTLWIGHRFGIIKARKRYKYFENYFFDPKGWNKSKGTSIEAYSMIESAEDTVYALYGFGGFGVIPPDSGKVEKRYRYLKKNSGLALSTGAMLVPAEDSTIWIGVRWVQSTLLNFDPRTRVMKKYPIPKALQLKEKGEKFRGEHIQSLFKGKDGQLWFIHRNGRFYSFNLDSLQHSCQDSTRRFLRGVIGVDEEGLWICNEEFLYFWHYKNGLTHEYRLPHIGTYKAKLPIFKVVPFQDKVWIGSRNGLLEFDKKSKKFNRYTTKNGLSHNLIYTIIPYGHHLWMGTNNGLSRFNIKNKDFKNYYQSDGLTYNEFNRESALKTKNGKLYFGGLNGINAFYPDVLDSLSNLKASPLVWTHFSKLDRKRDSLIGYDYHELDTSQPIIFRYGDKSFSFQFALLSYHNPSKNSLYYKLDGYEKDWNFNKNTFFVNYASLPPGTYTLRVKAKDALGNFSANELSIPIIVYGPWWKRWWARSLFSLLVVFGVLWIFNRQTTAFERQKKVLEKTVKERTAEIEKQKERAEQQRERAEQSEKYKQQFLANMSHEIRTPMHAISGMVKILRRNQHLPDQDVFLDAMQVSSENLVVLLNDVLDLSKIEAGKLDVEQIPMNPRDVIKNVVQILQYKAEEKGLVLYSEINEDIPELVMGDPTRLNQILVNLVGNAIKFTERGSVKILLTHENYHLKYSIQDTGIGIPKEKLQHIFEAFEQAKNSTSRSYGGTGLGLSISKQLTEIQGGTISVESEEGVGSTFYLQMPLILADMDAVGHDVLTEAQLKKMADALIGLHILIAEDNDFNKMIAQDDLEYYIEAVKIDVVENGKLAVEAFQNNEYDLILMDVQMPEMNGFEATRAIRQLKKGSTIPIIAMTASLLKTEIENCLNAGMNNYIPKPYKQEELIGRIFEEVKKVKKS